MSGVSTCGIGAGAPRGIEQPAQHEAAHHVAAIILPRARAHQLHRHLGRLFEPARIQRTGFQELLDLAQAIRHRADAADGKAAHPRICGPIASSFTKAARHTVEITSERRWPTFSKLPP